MTQVVTADPTTTVVTATVNPTVFGQSVTFTATVTANAPGSGIPTGKIAFQNGGVTIAGCSAVTLVAGVATCTTNALTVGAHSITGVFNGSASYLTSTSSTLTETVNLGSTTTAVAASVNPSVTGQSGDVHGNGDGRRAGRRDTDRQGELRGWRRDDRRMRRESGRRRGNGHVRVHVQRRGNAHDHGHLYR